MRAKASMVLLSKSSYCQGGLGRLKDDEYGAEESNAILLLVMLRSVGLIPRMKGR